MSHCKVCDQPGATIDEEFPHSEVRGYSKCHSETKADLKAYSECV
jgi:hypothetical protein